MIQATITKPLQELRDAIEAEDKDRSTAACAAVTASWTAGALIRQTAQRPKLYSGGGGGG